jgi:ParB/RepB/Spo0J family partition protein
MGKKIIKGEGVTVVVEKIVPPMDHMTLEVWPLERLTAHPDNPRSVRTDSDGFQDLVASVKANGVLEPLTARTWVDTDKGRGEARKALGVEFRQVLSGHRRMAAAKLAGYTHVPVRNLGEIDDAVAFDIVAMANLHEDLTPLEEGKRAAMWLDRYNQDARAVASKLGKSPHFVVQHAQIYRNLVSDWVRAAESGEYRHGTSLREMLERWTASHWAVIARLPHAIQIQQLKKFQSGGYCSFDRWTVKELEDRIGLEMLDLSQAPFDAATCEKCLNRTGAQPAFLWAEDEDGARGDRDKCLDKKCWDKKCARAEREKFKTAAAEKELVDAVPLCLLKEPEDYWKAVDHKKKISALKKIHGKKLFTAETVEIVKKDTKGAVPTIVVAGKGKGAVKWVKPRPAEKGLKLNRNEIDYAKQREQQVTEARRWKIVEDWIVEAICAMTPPDLAVVAVMARCLMPEICVKDVTELFRETARRSGTVREAYVRDVTWLEFVEDIKFGLNVESDLLQPFCDLLGIEIDCQKMYEEIIADETGGEPVKDVKAKKRQKASKKAGAACDGDASTCEVGCEPCGAESCPEFGRLLFPL